MLQRLNETRRPTKKLKPMIVKYSFCSLTNSSR